MNAINPIEMDNPEAAYTTAVTRKIIQLTLEDAEIIELMRILFDDDAEGTLSFMRMHFKAVTGSGSSICLAIPNWTGAFESPFLAS